jgi:hypothetical protein
MRNGLSGSILMLATLLPREAAALDCVVYDIKTAYHEFADNPESYLLVFGRMENLRPAFPGDTRRADDYAARFTGFTASPRAFDRPFQADVAVDFSQLSLLTGETGLAPEAAAEVDGQDGLIWLEVTDTGYRARYNLCWPLVDTDPASVKPALRCLRGGHCPTPQFD